jgi:hypothetical protein
MISSLGDATSSMMERPKNIERSPKGFTSPLLYSMVHPCFPHRTETLCIGKIGNITLSLTSCLPFLLFLSFLCGPFFSKKISKIYSARMELLINKEAVMP